MKKLFVLVAGLLIGVTLFSQETNYTPTMWLGGEITFGALSGRDVTLGPSFGLMITDQIGAGATLLYSTGNNSNEWGLELYGRYYLPIAEQFYFFGDAFLLFGGGDPNTTVDNNEYNRFDLGARIGLQYWFTPQWSMAASNNLLLYESRDGNGEFGAGVNFSTLNFSFFFHF
jgi:hypothetical protein